MAVSGGNSGSSEAFSLVAGNSHQAIAFLQTAANATDEETVIEQAEKIIDLPPNQRFAKAGDILSLQLGLEEDISELEKEDLPPWLQEVLENQNAEELAAQVLKLIESDLRRVRKRLYKETLQHSQGVQDYIILSVLFMHYEDLIHLMANQPPEDVENPEALLSLYSVLASHLILIDSGDRDEVYPELIQDLSRFPYYFKRISDTEAELVSAEMSYEEMKIGILIDGAAELYREEDITVARGAELAGVPRDLFEKQLTESGIRPDYGPETVDELRDDVDL